VCHAENWRERVDDVRWIELGVYARRTDATAGVRFLGPGPPTPPTGLETIDAFEAIGLLDASDAAVWRERFVATQPPSESARPASDRPRRRVRHPLQPLGVG
jgi:hypothetical protein